MTLAHLRDELAALPNLPALLLLGANVAGCTGTLTDVKATDDAPDTITVALRVPRCSCTDPDNDVDPDCARHYPAIPDEFVRVLAHAIQSGRLWELGGRGHAAAVNGVSEPDVNAAIAVCNVLFHPGRNGVLV